LGLEGFVVIVEKERPVKLSRYQLNWDAIISQVKSKKKNQLYKEIRHGKRKPGDGF
jgi:hypothetical protein